MQTTTAIERAVNSAGSQAALAAAVGVSSGLVWQWLNGAAISTRHFAAIAQATGVSVTDLLADEMTKAAQRVAKTKVA